MSFTRKLTPIALAAALAALAGCESAPIQMGDPGANTVATGGAAGSTAAGASEALEHCSAPLGTVSLVENQNAGWYTILTNQYRLPPTANLLRLLVQQSNCFVVVERSAAGMAAIGRERQLSDSGEMRGGSHFQKGQLVASDYALSPEVIFHTANAGGIGGGLGGWAGVIGAVVANTQTRQASAMLNLVDNRSGVQVASSSGSASKTDFGGFGALFGGSVGGALGAYERTPEGKVIAAAFMDAYNQMVVSMRGYQPQTVQGQGLGGGGRLSVDGSAPTSATFVSTHESSGALLPIAKAQERLNEKGYNVGTPDGSIGPRTVSGLQAFQRANGLPVTGRLDAATSEALAR